MGYAVLDPDELEPWDHPDRESTLRPIGAPSVDDVQCYEASSDDSSEA